MDMKRRRGLGVLHLLLYWTKGHKSEEVVPASRGRKKAEEIDSRSSKRNAIEAAIQKIEKEFGKGSVCDMGRISSASRWRWCLAGLLLSM